MSTHMDGSPCSFGTQRVPDDWSPCCADFLARTLSCHFDIRYEHSEQHGWMIAIHQTAGGGGIEMTFCPHCGVRLRE